MLRKSLSLILILLAPALLIAQQSFEQPLDPYSKIIVSPQINLILTEGETESVRIEFEDVAESAIHAEVNGSTLNLYLEGARYVEKTKKVDYNYRESIYKNAQVTAYVTFKKLEGLEVRGDQDVISESPINAEKFKLTVYGSNRVKLPGINAENLKVTSYGENELKITGGTIGYQKYTLYGSSHIEVSEVKSRHTKTKIYGESQMALYASDELDISAFGEPIITYGGNPVVNKNIIIGEARLFRVK